MAFFSAFVPFDFRLLDDYVFGAQYTVVTQSDHEWRIQSGHLSMTFTNNVAAVPFEYESGYPVSGLVNSWIVWLNQDPLFGVYAAADPIQAFNATHEVRAGDAGFAGAFMEFLMYGTDGVNGSSGNDYLTGFTGADGFSGGAGSDVFWPGEGNDQVIGDGGPSDRYEQDFSAIDTIVFASPRSSAVFSSTYFTAPSSIEPILFDYFPGLQVTTPLDGTDRFINIERLVFANNEGLALDTQGSGHAAEAARVIGAVLGADALANPLYAGIALRWLDSGMTYTQVAETALGYTGKVGGDAVELLWANVMHTPLPADVKANDIHFLLQGSLGALVIAFAASAQNEANIDLVGIQHTGLPYDYQGPSLLV